MRVLVTGSRDWADYKRLYSVLHTEIVERYWEKGHDEQGRFIDWVIPEDFVLVHGACPTGADLMADDWILSWDRVAETHPADWKKYGKRAGYVRNAEMVEAGADLCLAFILNKSRGATMTADLAEEAGIRTVRIEE